MYSKKYRLKKITSRNATNHRLYESMTDKICYLGFFRIGERGWFLCDNGTDYDPVHRIHTSVVNDVKYEENGNVVVTTHNTEYTFEIEG